MSEPQYPVLRKCVEDGMQHTVSLEETHSIHKQICLDIAEKYSKFETIDVASMIRNYVTRALSQVVSTVHQSAIKVRLVFLYHFSVLLCLFTAYV